MATFKNTFIDALWRSAGMPPIALPGTSPVQYSRTPSVFIPALLAAVLSPAALTALVNAWNTLSAKLSGAAPVVPSVAAVTAGIVAESGNCDAAQPLITTALGHFSLSPPVTLIGNAGQLALSANGLQASLTSSGVTPRFAPIPLNDLFELGANLPAMASQLSSMFGAYLTLQTAIIATGAPAPTTIDELATSATFRELEVGSATAAVNDLNKAIWGAGAAADLVAAGTESVTGEATVAAILAWVNAKAGGPAVSITASGAPFPNLQTWRLAQGI